MKHARIGPAVLPIIAVMITAGLVWGPVGAFVVAVLWVILVGIAA